MQSILGLYPSQAHLSELRETDIAQAAGGEGMRRKLGDGRYRQLVRCVRIMRAVSGQRRLVNLPALASQFRVTTRTIRRDLAALAAAGVEVPHGYEKDVTS